MPQIIKDRQLVEDHWQTAEADATIDNLPAGDVIVSAQTWQENREALIARDGGLGITLDGDDDLEAIVPDLAHFQVVALQFPAFRDGRAYSMARRLREHTKYDGEIRAIGDILRDQVAYMERVGFNAFEINSRQKTEDALNAFEEITVKYQASSDESLPIYRRSA